MLRMLLALPRVLCTSYGRVRSRVPACRPGSLQGWDVLLRAFLTAFTAADRVLLLLHTKPFHSDADFPRQMEVGRQARRSTQPDSNSQQ